MPAFSYVTSFLFKSIAALSTATHHVWSHYEFKHACSGKRGLKMSVRTSTTCTSDHSTFQCTEQDTCLYRHTDFPCSKCLVLRQGFIWYKSLVPPCSHILPGFTTGHKRALAVKAAICAESLHGDCSKAGQPALLTDKHRVPEEHSTDPCSPAAMHPTCTIQEALPLLS